MSNLEPEVQESSNLKFPNATELSRIGDAPFQRRCGNRRRGSQIVPGFGMSIAAWKIPRLVGNHHLFLTHRSHIDSLIRTGAGRKHNRTGIVKGFDESLL